MSSAHSVLTRGATWTIAAFGVNQLIRFGTNVVLTRLLAPELFGIMVILNTLKNGMELISDVGIGQSIIYNRNAENPDFYNTAWTLQSIRGLILWVIACALAVPVAHFYRAPILLTVIPVGAFVLVLAGVTPLNQFLIQKRLQIPRLTIFEVISGSIWAAGQIALGYFIPTIWALVFGLIFGSATHMVGSHFLLPDTKYRFKFSQSYALQILHFGKWIFLSSMVYFFSINFDRLYLAGVIPLSLLGVYGISRSISELLSMLALRIGNLVVFPFIASHSHVPIGELHKQLAPIRLKFLVLAAFGFSFCAVTVDLAIKIVFDERYHAAAWMAPVLIVGAWVSILCTMNESALLGIGKPRYGAIANGVKCTYLLIGLPLSFHQFGIFGSIFVIAGNDLFRYGVMFVGQRKERFSFGIQDTLVTVGMLCVISAFELLRLHWGFGSSFSDLPNLFNQ